ncbi:MULTISPECIES: hypothetical protein [Methylomicrobium]|uniref:hypothetical protein n=1 Tax=Methylomicrobium TaxID=39773 RepID=UPI0002DC9BFB|nr:MULTISPECIES: hypothetical protein [Methylomicrobium]
MRQKIDLGQKIVNVPKFETKADQAFLRVPGICMKPRSLIDLDCAPSILCFGWYFST